MNKRANKVISPNDLALQQQMMRDSVQQAKARQEAQLQAEIRAVGRDVYTGMVTPYLTGLVMGSQQLGNTPLQRYAPDPVILKRIAWMANKAAPLLHEAMGLANVDEKKHWADEMP